MRFNEPEPIGQLRHTLARFVAREMPRQQAAAWGRTNHFPPDVCSKLAELGVTGLTIPEQQGGAGQDIRATYPVRIGNHHGQAVGRGMQDHLRGLWLG